MPLELNYKTVRDHEPMLRDEVRCQAFRQALIETITPESVVLDIGAGTGILSLFAAQAGAKSVYAVERTEVARFAAQLVADNGYSDRVQIYHGDVEDLELPEKVDIIVSEWLGGYGIDENLLPIVVQARDRWLKPGGVMIPGTMTSWIAPAYDAYLDDDIDFWTNRPYGLNFSAVARDLWSRTESGCHHITDKHLPCPGQMMWAIDAHTCTVDQANGTYETELEFISTRNGAINVLASWFETMSGKNVVLSNGPSHPDTHWGRTVFPLGKTIPIRPETRMKIHFIHHPHGKGRSNAQWAIEVDNYRFESQDTTTLI